MFQPCRYWGPPFYLTIRICAPSQDIRLPPPPNYSPTPTPRKAKPKAGPRIGTAEVLPSYEDIKDDKPPNWYDDVYKVIKSVEATFPKIYVGKRTNYYKKIRQVVKNLQYRNIILLRYTQTKYTLMTVIAKHVKLKTDTSLSLKEIRVITTYVYFYKLEGKRETPLKIALLYRRAILGLQNNNSIDEKN